MLTERIVRNAKSEGKAWTVWDKQVTGLGLQITPSGKKNFVVRYRVDGKWRQRIVCRAGHISLEEVRRIASEVQLRVRAGGRHDSFGGAPGQGAQKRAPVGQQGPSARPVRELHDPAQSRMPGTAVGEPPMNRLITAAVAACLVLTAGTASGEDYVRKLKDAVTAQVVAPCVLMVAIGPERDPEELTNAKKQILSEVELALNADAWEELHDVVFSASIDLFPDARRDLWDRALSACLERGRAGAMEVVAAER